MPDGTGRPIRTHLFTHPTRGCFPSLVVAQGFAEIVDYRMTVKICCGEVDTDEVESFCAQVEAPPEVTSVFV